MSVMESVNLGDFRREFAESDHVPAQFGLEFINPEAYLNALSPEVTQVHRATRGGCIRVTWEEGVRRRGMSVDFRKGYSNVARFDAVGSRPKDGDAPVDIGADLFDGQAVPDGFG
jgi:hypothetical protein